MRVSKSHLKKFDALFIVQLLFISAIMMSVLINVGSSVESGEGWWDSDWLYRNKGTIHHAQVAADLTNFSVLIDVTNPDLASAQNDGDDIVFVDNSNHTLDHEIELFNQTNGHLVAWVRFPNLSSTVDTEFYLYYGNLNASNQENPEGVWDSNFLMVQHLSETSGTHYDSTSNLNDGEPSGSVNQNATGKIAGCDEFNGGYIGLPQVCSTETQFTFSAWIYAKPGARYFVFQRSGTEGAFLQIYQDSQTEFYVNANRSVKAITMNEWHFVVGTFNGTTVRLYVDGGSPSTTTSNLTWPSQSMYLGDSSSHNRKFNGSIDEVRVSNIPRSVAWITTEYNNQHDPSSFYTIETGAPTLSDPSPENGATRVDFNPVLSINATDLEGDNMTIIFMSNASGTWEKLGTYTGGNGTYTHNRGWKDPGTLDTVAFDLSPYAGRTLRGDVYISLKSSDGSTSDIEITEISFVDSAQTSIPLSGWSMDPRYTNASYVLNSTESSLSLELNAADTDSRVTIRNLNVPKLNLSIYDYVSVDVEGSGNARILLRFFLDDGSSFDVAHVRMDSFDTTYYWKVCAVDNGGANPHWTNKTYHFTTIQMLELKWVAEVPAGGANQLHPVIGDINGDGEMEIVLSCNGYVVALNGTDGSELWRYSPAVHRAITLADLTNDGIPEVLGTIGDGYPNRAFALFGNGTRYWQSQVLSGELLCDFPITAYDIDGDGYPTIYVASEDTTAPDYTGSLTALNHKGEVLASTFVWHPCTGGPTVADYDFDGVYEVYLGDRWSDLGRGMRSWWASNLTSRWNQSNVHCSSTMPVLVDVNGDGLLEVIANHVVGNGLVVIDASDGHIIQNDKKPTGYLPAHATPTVYDVDLDGNLEVILSVSRDAEWCKPEFVVWDLSRRDVDVRVNLSDWNSWCAWPPTVGDVDGDGIMEIIAAIGNEPNTVGSSTRDFPILIYDHNYNLIAEIPAEGAGCLTGARVQDIDGDGLSEVVVAGVNGKVLAYDTMAPTPDPRPRTWIQYYSEYRQGAAEYVEPPWGPEPMEPVLNDEQPTHGSTEIPLNPTLSVRVVDYQYDPITVVFETYASGTWQKLGTYTSGNGIYTQNTTNMDKHGATYFWAVTATDHKGHSTHKIYKLTTASINTLLPLSGWSMDPRYTNASYVLNSTESSLSLELNATDINSRVTIRNLNVPKLNLSDYQYMAVDVVGSSNARILLRFFLDDGSSFDVVYWKAPTTLNSITFDLSPYAGRTLRGDVYISLKSSDGSTSDIEITEISFVDSAQTPVPLSGWSMDPRYTNASYVLNSTESSLSLELNATDTASRVTIRNLNVPKLNLSIYDYVSVNIGGSGNARILLRFFLDDGSSFDVVYWKDPDTLDAATFDLSPYSGRTLRGDVYIGLKSSNGTTSDIEISETSFVDGNG
jgi:hypothetical protein